MQIENNEIQISDLKLSNYPNPFSSETTISFDVTQTSLFVNLEIYNIKGQKVKTLECFNSFEAKATKSLSHITWNGKNDFGKPAKSGIYFLKLKTGNSSIMRKMILIR